MAVAQVPLSDDGACEGGLLLFACPDGRLLHVQRRVGSIMAHDGDAVHGVTQLVKGIRCRARIAAAVDVVRDSLVFFERPAPASPSRDPC
jgi:hypothetical protein